MDNRYGLYRSIRHARTNRTLGKMSWWRVALGLALLLFVLLLSGAVSQRLANAGQFKAADALMLSDTWMEKYKPELKAYIEAGVLYQQGDYAAAAEAFGQLEGLAAAEAMRGDALVKLAAQALEQGDRDAAYAALSAVKPALLSEERLRKFRELSTALYAWYAAAETEDALERAQALQDMLSTA